MFILLSPLIEENRQSEGREGGNKSEFVGLFGFLGDAFLAKSRDQDTGFSLVEGDHLTWILASHRFIVIM